MQTLLPEETVKTARKPRGKNRIKTADPGSAPKETLTSMEVRKPVEMILIRNRKDEPVSLMQRKAINNLLAYAQMVDRQVGTEMTSYMVPIAEFERMLGHTDNKNRSQVKEIIMGLTKLQVQFDYQCGSKSDSPMAGWGIANMISEIYISPDNTTVMYSLPPNAKRQMLRPDRFNQMRIMILNQFTSYAAMTLYEEVGLYLTSPGRCTPKMHWQDWSVVLSGSSTPHAVFRDFNKMLTRAIDQVNTMTNGWKVVPYVTTKERKTDMLWFCIEDDRQSRLGFEGDPICVSAELKKRLSSFGLSDTDVEALAFLHDEDYLFAQASFMEKRLSSKNHDPIQNPKAFFNKAVKENYADAPRQSSGLSTDNKPLALTVDPATIKVSMEEVRDAWYKSKRREISENFELQGEKQKEAMVAQMEEQLQANKLVWNSYRRKGIDNPLVRNAIIDIIVKTDVTEPTEDQLMAFAKVSGLNC